MDTVHVTERITAASLCISRNGKPLSRFFFFERTAKHSFANVISFYDSLGLFGSWLIMQKFPSLLLLRLKRRIFREMNVIGFYNFEEVWINYVKTQ